MAKRALARRAEPAPARGGAALEPVREGLHHPLTLRPDVSDRRPRLLLHGGLDVRDVLLGQPLRVDLRRLRRDFRGRQDLHGADTVASDGFQQVEGFARSQAQAIADPVPDVGVVRQQVVEIVVDLGSFDLARRRESMVDYSLWYGAREDNQRFRNPRGAT